MRQLFSILNTYRKALTIVQLVYGIGPLLLLLLILIGSSYRLNNRLTTEQLYMATNITRDSLHPLAQLQREHLRFYALMHSVDPVVDHDAYLKQKDLVESRLRIFQITVDSGTSPSYIEQIYLDYVAQWDQLNTLLTIWTNSPENVQLRPQVLNVMAEMEVGLNHALYRLQLNYQDQLGEWAVQTLTLNRIVTGGGVALGFVLLLMYGMTLRFAHNQAANQQELQAGKQQLQTIFDVLPDAVYLVNREGVYTYYKPAKDQPIRHLMSTVVGQHITKLLPKPAATELYAGICHVLETRQELLIEYTATLPALEQERGYEVRLLPSGQNEVQIIERDITELKRREEAALQGQKMESLGVLAGGVAHDFNNLLTGMLGQTSLALARLERGLPAIENIKRAALSAERAADLTRQLLAYAGKGKFHIVPVDINQLIEDTVHLIESTVPNQVCVKINLDQNLGLIQADRGQMQQVFLNFLINALEALAGNSGQITITSSQREITAASPVEQMMPQPLPFGRYMTVIITDTGTGMTASTVSRIFDPFFSTKPQGHGLGLATIMGIIRTHQGGLTVDSVLGEGTTFTIYFPIVEVAAKAHEKQVPLVSTAMAQQIRILHIDDEDSVREVVADILGSWGISVRSAANGYDGVALFEQHHKQINVVLLDMKMPGIDGLETYQLLRQIQPDVKVIFSSGYSAVEYEQLVRDHQSATVLTKPYQAEQLIQKIVGLHV